EKDSTDAAHLSTMLQKEVLVAPFFKPRIETGIVTIACLFNDAMEMCGVFRVGITGREIRASAEPRSLTLLEVSKIRVDRGNHRAPRVEDERHARSEK